MTTTGGRLAAVATTLTPSERAHVALPAWVDSDGGAPTDQRLVQYLTEDEKKEFNALVEVVLHANQEFYQ